MRCCTAGAHPAVAPVVALLLLPQGLLEVLEQLGHRGEVYVYRLALGLLGSLEPLHEGLFDLGRKGEPLEGPTKG